MAGKTVIIGCRLPHGIVLENPMKPDHTVRLKGLKDSPIRDGNGLVVADHVTTEVDGDFWEVWKTVHKDFAPLRAGAIFEARDIASAASIAKERKKEKTGFEPVDPKAHGVKPATTDDE